MDDTNEIQENYDALAPVYARELGGELEFKPFDRELLDEFSSSIGCGSVCEVGCGPGHVGAYLASKGCDVVGLDISAKMIAIAQELNPGRRFFHADMSNMPFASESFDGVVAFYAIVNSTAAAVRRTFDEIARVLKSSGRLLLAFHVGDSIVAPQIMWDIPVSLKFQFFSTPVIVDMLADTGFAIDKVLEREPYPVAIEHQSRRCYIVAIKESG